MNPRDQSSAEGFSQPDRRCSSCGQPGYIQASDGRMLCATCFVRSRTQGANPTEEPTREEAPN